MKNEILICNKTKKKISERLIKSILSQALNFLKIKQPVEMAVLIVDKSEIKKLNKVWRGKNQIVDELSFGLNSRKLVKFAKANNGMLELGEIVINVDKISNKEHLSKILIHALLHLLGHHHEKSAVQAKKMEYLEEKILKHLSI